MEHSPPTETSILLVEDDPALQRSIQKGLREQDYTVFVAGNLHTARELSAVNEFDLVLLDLGLPDGSGLDFLREYRTKHPSIPVMIMTARNKVPDRIKGLDLGADDYLVKPFDFQELSARIRVQLRRSSSQSLSSITVADLEIDLVRRTISRNGTLIDCTPREFDVLVFLAQSPGVPVSRQVLTTEVWKVRSRMTSMDNVIDVLMSRLRDKIDADHPVKLIHTVRGLGFMLKENK